jgi:CRP-like cAMP-binding protein
MSAEIAAEQVVTILGRVPLFEGLPSTDLERIAALARAREMKAGEFLFREGDAGDRFFAVTDGAVEILKERPLGDHERIGVKRGGESFSEMALLVDGPRTTSVRALEDSRLVSVSREDFDALLGGETLAVRLINGLARALRAREARYTSRQSVGGADALRELGHQVLEGLEPGAAPPAEGFRIAGATARDDAVDGGSLWDGLTTADGRTRLILLDVKGTGLPPAHLIAVTRALFQEVGVTEPLETLLRRLNAGTFRNLFEGLDECVEAAVIEVARDGVRWTCAGEQPGVILRADGSTEDVPTHGPPLGILPQFRYDVTSLGLEAGDVFLAFSMAPPSLVKGAAELARERQDAEPAELARLIRSALRKIQARGAESDVSFVVIKKA